MRWTVETCLFPCHGLPLPAGEPGSGSLYPEFGHGRTFLQVEVDIAGAVGTLGGCAELGEGVGVRVRQDFYLGDDGPLLLVVQAYPDSGLPCGVGDDVDLARAGAKIHVVESDPSTVPGGSHRIP